MNLNADKIKKSILNTHKKICNNIAKFVLLIEYIFIVLPTALIIKITGRDRLCLKKGHKPTYWKNYRETGTDYERTF